jgi:hypothetical protein
MSDIARKLRSPEVFIDTGGLHSPVAHEAADIITRLTAENERLRAVLNADPQTLRLHLGEMTAQEVRTLRAGFQWALASAALK